MKLMTDNFPIDALEAAGVDNFRVDCRSKTVFLSQADLQKLSDHVWRSKIMGMGAPQPVTVVNYRGWQFEPVADPKEKRYATIND